MQNAPIRSCWPIVAYAIVDAIGMVLFITGALWLVEGRAMFFPGFPAHMNDALMTTFSGLVLATWAASRIIRELIKRPAGCSGKTGKQ